MVLLAPTVTALQILLEACRAYAGPHDVVYNTTKTVCMLVRPKQSHGQFPTRVRLGNEELSFVVEFCYLGHIMTADCRDDKDIKKQFRRQNAVGNMLVRKFSFAPIEAKIQLFKSYCYPIFGCALVAHVASLFTSLPRAATPTIFSEVVLQASQHQLPQALATSTAHRIIITSLQMGPISRNLVLALLANVSLFSQPPSHHQATSQQVSSNQEASTSSCMKTTLEISHKIFIAEPSFWEAIALAKFSAPPRALHRHTRVPCKISEESRADYCNI